MEVTEILSVKTIAEWRQWLANNHDQKTVIWLLFERTVEGTYHLDYMETVEQALCFGWIDGIAKKIDATRKVQRFTPRQKNSHWTELNKQRARRLVQLGMMTPAGLQVLPDLTINQFVMQPELVQRLQADAEVYRQFQQFPSLYVRVRISYIQEYPSGSAEYEKRLAHFIKQTKQGKYFGNWNDSGKLSEE